MANFYMSNKNWNTLQNYARHAWTEYSSEIGGFLIAEQDEDNKWKMHKPVILKQEISGGNTILDKDALAEYYVKTAIKMKNKPFQFVWWHSHHTMEVFWSGTDLTAIDEFSNGLMSISLVINLKEEYKLRVNLWKPYKMHEDVEMDIIDKPKVKIVPKGIRSSVDELCSKPVSITYLGNNKLAKYKISDKTRDQMAIWQQPGYFDSELIQLEAKLDNILVDYLQSLDYNTYVSQIKELNTHQRNELSELRCGLVKENHERYLFTAISSFDSDQWIHRDGTEWNFLDKCIENNMDFTEDDETRWGGITNVSSPI